MGSQCSRLLDCGQAEQIRRRDRTSPASRHRELDLRVIFVLYAYGGWSHAAFVAAEVRDQRRNLPRALVLGIAAITLIYFVVNATYWLALGSDGVRITPTPAADVMEQAVGPLGGRAISLLVMLSALGAINGMILTATRVYAAWGADYPALSWLSTWNRGAAAPVAAIAVQTAIAVLLILIVGTALGRDSFDAAPARCRPARLALEGIPRWIRDARRKFDARLLVLSLMTGFAVFLLRAKDRASERPFKIPLFPLPAILFCADLRVHAVCKCRLRSLACPASGCASNHRLHTGRRDAQGHDHQLTKCP